MIHYYFKIEILAVRDEFITQGHKGLIEIPKSYFNKANIIIQFVLSMKRCMYFAPRENCSNSFKVAVLSLGQKLIRIFEATPPTSRRVLLQEMFIVYSTSKRIFFSGKYLQENLELLTSF